MMAALWLVVAIAIVALAFSVDAKERRTLGLNAAERGRGRAEALGALASLQATLDVALRSNAQNAASLAGTRSGDPWMFADSLFSGPLYVDSNAVDVQVRDLGTQLNINTADSAQLKAFFSYTLGDFTKADQLAATIADWRDVDDTPRINSDERDGYIKKGLLVLPANGPFSQIEDLLNVEGMTPQIFARVSRDLTTYGNGQINVNTAPIEVLRSIPGITDDIIANILNQRSRGLRIATIAQLVPGVAATGGRGGRGAGPGAAMANIQLAQLTRSAGVTTSQLLVTLTAKPSPQAQPTNVNALITRNGTTATISWVR